MNVFKYLLLLWQYVELFKVNCECFNFENDANLDVFNFSFRVCCFLGIWDDLSLRMQNPLRFDLKVFCVCETWLRFCLATQTNKQTHSLHTKQMEEFVGITHINTLRFV